MVPRDQPLPALQFLTKVVTGRDLEVNAEAQP
jgi:hypothetical protein